MNEKGVLLPHPFLELIEAICIAWFTLEYTIRLMGAPKKCEFLKNGMNIIDVLSILPFFIELFMNDEQLKVEDDSLSPMYSNMTTVVPLATDNDYDALDEEEKDKEGFKGLVQVFRVFKLARQENGEFWFRNKNIFVGF